MRQGRRQTNTIAPGDRCGGHETDGRTRSGRPTEDFGGHPPRTRNKINNAPRITREKEILQNRIGQRALWARRNAPKCPRSRSAPENKGAWQDHFREARKPPQRQRTSRTAKKKGGRSADSDHERCAELVRVCARAPAAQVRLSYQLFRSAVRPPRWPLLLATPCALF